MRPWPLIIFFYVGGVENFKGQGLMPPTRWKYWVRGRPQAFEVTLQAAWLHFADYDPHSVIFGSYL